MKTSMQGVLIFTLLFSQPLLALSLNEAREQGLVGETLSGYISPLKQSDKTQELVKSINEARAAHYQQLADSNTISVDEVAKLAGQKLVTRALPGEYVRGINGQWMKK